MWLPIYGMFSVKRPHDSSSLIFLHTLDFLQAVSSDLTFLYFSGPLIWTVFHSCCQKCLALAPPAVVESSPGWRPAVPQAGTS